MTDKEKYLNELNVLMAYKKVAETEEGKTVITDIFKMAEIYKDPFVNSGFTANTLGKQAVGRKVFDRLIAAGVEVDCSVFSKKSKDRIEELKVKIQTLLNK